MEIQEALEFIRKLAAGLHPETGERLGNDSLFQLPQTIRALHRAILALEFQQKKERTLRYLPANAGKPWTDVEDTRICEELRRGINFQEIARLHGRTDGSIVARLIRLGKISSPATRANFKSAKGTS